MSALVTFEIKAADPDHVRLLSQLAFRSKAWWGYDQSFKQSCVTELHYKFTPRIFISSSQSMPNKIWDFIRLKR